MINDVPNMFGIILEGPSAYLLGASGLGLLRCDLHHFIMWEFSFHRYPFSLQKMHNGRWVAGPKGNKTSFTKKGKEAIECGLFVN